MYEDEPEVYALLAQAGADQQVPDRFGETPAMVFEREFGMTIDAAYFRKAPEDL